MAKCLCRNCNKNFKSVKSFDMHRTGSYGEGIYKPSDTQRKNPIGQMPSTRRCMTTEEMLAIGMCQNEQNLWITAPYDPTIKHKDEDDEQEEGHHTPDSSQGLASTLERSVDLFKTPT